MKQLDSRLWTSLKQVHRKYKVFALWKFLSQGTKECGETKECNTQTGRKKACDLAENWKVLLTLLEIGDCTRNRRAQHCWALLAEHCWIVSDPRKQFSPLSLTISGPHSLTIVVLVLLARMAMKTTNPFLGTQRIAWVDKHKSCIAHRDRCLGGWIIKSSCLPFRFPYQLNTHIHLESAQIN